MTQVDAQFPEHGREPRTHPLAIASLVTAVVCVCAPIAPLLGLGALATMGGDPPKKGTGLAIAGIVLGLLITAGLAIVGIRGYDFVKSVERFVTEAPGETLAAGTGGDTAAFKDAFHGAGATASDDEARAFLDALTERYGAFVDATPAGEPQQTFGEPDMLMPFELDFDDATVDAEIELIFADPDTGQPFINKLGFIRVVDPDRGDLVYPAVASDGGASGAAGADGADASGADGADGADADGVSP